MKKLKGEALDGVAVIAVAGLLIWGAMAIDLDLWDGRGVSPRFFPVFLACLIALFGLCIIARAWRGNIGEREADPIPTFDFRAGAYEIRLPAPAFLILAAVLLLLLVKPFGFFLAASAFIFTLLKILRTDKGATLQSGIIAVGVAGIIFVTFYYGFRISLPLGFGL